MKARLSTLSDEDIFLLIKQENKEAFAEIYRRYWKELVDAAYKRVRSAEKATEIVQQLFVTIYTRRKTITFNSSLRNYLQVALRNRVLNDVRNGLVHNSYQQHVLSSPAAFQQDAASQLQLKELQQLIDKTYAMLPEKCRQVFLLSRQEHLSYQHIARQLGISVNTVEKHMGKALRILRAGLKEYTPGIIWLIAGTLFC